MKALNIVKAAFKRDKSYLIGLLLTFFALTTLFIHHDWQLQSQYSAKKIVISGLPDFSSGDNKKEKLEILFGYLRPQIVKENNKIKYKQALLISVLKKMKNESYHVTSHSKKLHKLAKEFGLEISNIKHNIDELKLRIDTIPVSLILAQAANEPNWKQSRFFQQGFIGDYLRELNSKEQYQKLRDVRAGLRRRGQRVTGLKLAHGVKPFAKNNPLYVDQIVKIIKHNQLE